jgi:hypothetical protein
VANFHYDRLYSVLVWRLADTVVFSRRLRPQTDQPDVIRNMEIKPVQAKDVLSKLAGGEIVAVGEFRGVQVRTQKMEDAKTKQFVDRVLIESSVELGGMSRTVTEWTNPGTKESDVKLPTLNRGDVVLVLIETIKWYKGSKAISGMVRPLPSLV